MNEKQLILGHVILYAKGWYKRSNEVWKDYRRVIIADGRYNPYTRHDVAQLLLQFVLENANRLNKGHLSDPCYISEEIRKNLGYLYYWKDNDTENLKKQCRMNLENITVEDMYDNAVKITAPKVPDPLKTKQTLAIERSRNSMKNSLNKEDLIGMELNKSESRELSNTEYEKHEVKRCKNPDKINCQNEPHTFRIVKLDLGEFQIYARQARALYNEDRHIHVLNSNTKNLDGELKNGYKVLRSVYRLIKR